MARIACGGFHHETNTFAPVKATYRDFEAADGWPALSRGVALPAAVAGMNLPIAGFLEAASGHDLQPLLWCSACPSAQVTEDAYRRISGMLLADLADLLPVDAVFLDLHGAMVCEHLDDGEGALLAAVRALIGPNVPIVAALDLHANVTRTMVDSADGLVAYRTYPHVDMAATGRRAAALLDSILGGWRPAKALRKLPFLIPLVWQCTMIEPALSLYRRLESLELGNPALRSLSFTPGFPPADIAECGPAVLAYADTQEVADAAADALAAAVAAAEEGFAGPLYGPDEAVRYAITHRDRRPVVIADTQDNPGAGGNSDTVGMLEALVRNDARNAALAVLYDPEAAAAAHIAGEGAEIELAIGARSAMPDHRPFAGRFGVARLGDGRFTATGPMFGGSRMELGLMAALRIGGVEVVVASRKMQAADQAIFRHVGIEPKARDILVLKSSVHFRNDFTDIAGDIIVATAPGPNLADHAALPFRNLRRGLRVAPKGPEFGIG